MPLAPKTQIDRYDIRSLLGAGGMGEVYLAQDTSLNRRVALKVLPPEVASNHDRMRRFKQQATAAASLNHPSIAHIYEIGESNGLNFIAMEYVAGSTLRTKIHEEGEELPKLLRALQHVAKGLAVIPFVNQNHDAGVDWISDGLTESIINNLTQLPTSKSSRAVRCFVIKAGQTIRWR